MDQKNSINIAIIFAGGIGSRMKESIPKQFLVWKDKTILEQTVDVFNNTDSIDEIIISVHKDWLNYSKKLFDKKIYKKPIYVINGGSTALESQYLALKKAKKNHKNSKNVIVLIHDGVRPLIDADLINRNIECVKKYGNAITVSDAFETIIKVNKNNIISNITQRNKCKLARAPQSFYLDNILSIHEKTIIDNNRNYVDSASMMKDNGIKLHIVLCGQENIKITTPYDYYMYCGIIDSK